jgi:hypothetical protein
MIGGPRANTDEWKRAVSAGAVGGGLGVLLWLVVVAVTPSVVSGSACQQQAWGCLGDAIAGVAVAVVAVTVLAWPLLRLAGVRPAWLVALVALPVAFLVAHAYQAFIGSPAFAMRARARLGAAGIDPVGDV